MRICLWYDDTKYSEKAYIYPDEGNDGMAGTQYEYAMLMKYYSQAYPKDTILACHTTENKLLPNIADYLYKDTKDALCYIKSQQVDLVVFTVGQTEETYTAIEAFDYDIPFIAWDHNHIPYKELKRLRGGTKIKRVVCCGRELYDMYIDDAIIRKMSFIFNMYNQKCMASRQAITKKNVVYIGALTHNKGFHILAKVWKQIVEKVPDAELFVAGTGRLYNTNFIMGDHGLAEKSYEQLFMPYLLDENGVLLSSVHFLGIIGKKEKEKLFSTAKLGIVNPSGRTECCSISALELESCGIPIASYKGYGMVDVVADKHTGLLSRSDEQFRNNVIRLLLDNDQNNEFGENAKIFVENKFSPERIAKEWHMLFEEVVSGIKPQIMYPKANLYNRGKWLRVINATIKRFPLLKNMPSIIDYNEFRKRI